MKEQIEKTAIIVRAPNKQRKAIKAYAFIITDNSAHPLKE